MSKIALFQTIQFSISTQFSSIWPIERTLSGATTPGPNGPGSDGNEGVLHIPQSSSITGASLSVCLVSYPGHSLEGSYPFAEKQWVYSTVPANRAIHILGALKSDTHTHIHTHTHTHTCIYMYIYMYIYIYVCSVFESFKFSYQLFHIWMQWILEGVIFSRVLSRPPLFEGVNNEMANTNVSHIYL